MKSLFKHKVSTHILIVFIAVVISNQIHAQLVQHLPNECKFKQGDDLNWADLKFDDANWDTKLLATSWTSTTQKANVFAWYRIKIIIPSSMKSLAKNDNGIKLNLGKIDDVDQTFFNGKLIGQTGSLPPNYETKWDTNRSYIISENDVMWDKENIIAVRVFSPDNAGIGMYEGPYNFAPIQWSDYISTAYEILETDNNGFKTNITFTNNSDNPFDGSIKYWVADKTNTILFTETLPVEVKPVQGYKTVVSSSNYQPEKRNIFKVGYQILENNSAASIEDGQMYLANRHIEIPIAKEPNIIVENKIKDIYTSIPFQNQQFNGYLGKRQSQNLVERLLNVDEEGIIGSYLKRPGIHPWAGEHVGKYLETACNVWKNTHDARLKQQMDRIIYELINTQLEDGYLGTYTPDAYWASWDVWSHKYNLYGLLAYYTATGYLPALDACKKIGDLMCTTFGKNPGQRDIILAGTHVGMAATSILDPMVELYKYTGDKKYLDFCYYIIDAWEQENGPKIISTLLSTGKVNNVANGKAYEMLSNFVGMVNLYRVTGDEKLLNPVLIAWQDIVDNRLYITGTTSSWEHFQEDELLPATDKDHMGEGCVTVTWLQLNHGLLSITGELKYVNQIEKTIYNHLLAAENPETGCVSYYTPLMDKKPFICHISCCTSSVPRGIAMIPYFSFGNVQNSPTLMMYEPATYKETVATSKGKEIDLSLQIEGDFPESGDATITVNPSQKAAFALSLRVPDWCTSFKATIGKKEYRGIANHYLKIDRVWTSGDKIKVSFDMPIQILSGGKSYPNQIAFQRGPQVLAFDSSLNTGVDINTNPLLPTENLVVKTVFDVLPTQWIGKQTYTVNMIDKNGNDSEQQLILVPYADASQTGGEVNVWLPFNVKK